MKKNDSLADCVVEAMQQYFDDLNGEQPQKLHSFFISEVEKPFLKVVLDQVNGNQTRASEMLGINRNTLRKKLQSYDLS
ncbi:MAG: Fis family transcriptional regulator [Acidiferrobacterales bacterium]|nr:Fis family transcriptional regulator [Acidiferrobacterales bacterium]